MSRAESPACYPPPPQALHALPYTKAWCFAALKYERVGEGADREIRGRGKYDLNTTMRTPDLSPFFPLTPFYAALSDGGQRGGENRQQQ
jgi:hypothetical protein